MVAESPKIFARLMESYSSGIRRRIALLLDAIFFVLILLIVPACQSRTFEPPRVATATAQAVQSPTASPPPLISNAPTATTGAFTVESAPERIGKEEPATKLTFWTATDDDVDIDVLESGIADFTSATGIQVELVQVNPRLLPELIQSALISGTLPDLVLHPTEYSQGWAQQGILDPQAVSAVLNDLGNETFERDALIQMRVNDEAGLIAALPSTGWQQLILYRADWFEELDLLVPNAFDNLAAAAEAIHQEDSPVSGLIVPTDSSLVSTQQVFEHMAVANGCRLVSPDGEVALLHPACLEALEFYRALINAYSPVGLQTDISALNGYLSGRTGIIIASPEVLPAIAGLDETAQPSCPQCGSPGFLSSNTGMVTQLQGGGEFSQPANFAAISALGITPVADMQASMDFAEYWFETLYPAWISANPESKVPLRRGTQDNDSRFLDVWTRAPLAPGGPTIAEVFGPEAATMLSQDVASTNRWAVARGQGGLLSTVYEQLLLAPLLQDMLSGYFNSSETIVEMYLTVVDSIPGYDFPVQVAPSPTP